MEGDDARINNKYDQETTNEPSVLPRQVLTSFLGCSRTIGSAVNKNDRFSTSAMCRIAWARAGLGFWTAGLGTSTLMMLMI